MVFLSGLSGRVTLCFHTEPQIISPGSTQQRYFKQGLSILISHFIVSNQLKLFSQGKLHSLLSWCNSLISTMAKCNCVQNLAINVILIKVSSCIFHKSIILQSELSNQQEGISRYCCSFGKVGNK